jgi:hypothetical protein
VVGRSSPHEDYSDRIDVRKLVFPLPVDHRLIILVHYNVLRGILTNVNILALHHLAPPECNGGRGPMPLFPQPATIPESLRPTPLQQATPHESWIDLIPCPQMRDNAIKWAGQFDNDALCSDLVGGLHEDVGDVGFKGNGMLVWSDPWHFRGWELTEGFLRKWGFLVEGCRGLVESTNAWRERRGDEPLVVEIS